MRITYFEDADNDNYGNPDSTVQDCIQPNGYVQNNLDCNDNDSEINPAAVEILDDGIDQNCDGEDSTTSINELEVGQISFYPNPTSGKLFIELLYPGDLTIKLYDSLGKLVLDHQMLNTNSYVIDLDHFNAGYYTLKFIDKNSNSLIRRIIIE